MKRLLCKWFGHRPNKFDYSWIGGTPTFRCLRCHEYHEEELI